MKKHFLFGALAVAAVAIVACKGQAEQLSTTRAMRL